MTTDSDEISSTHCRYRRPTNWWTGRGENV